MKDNTTEENLDNLLDSLGYDPWMTFTCSFIMPTLSFIGAILCSLSCWIFYRKCFKDQVFFYYKLMCIINIIRLIIGIPFGLLYSPRYIPQMNTFVSTIYQKYCIAVMFFLLHFDDMLQIAILLDRMKIFNSCVNKYLTFRPSSISLVFFFYCLFIGFPVLFSFETKPLGIYDKEQVLYHFEPSEFVKTSFGTFLLDFTHLFLNLLLTTFIGITLNILSIFQYKRYLFKRKQREESYKIKYQSRKWNNRELLSRERNKEMNERNVEKNMFFMALTLCSLLIISRCTIIIGYILFYSYYSFQQTLILILLVYSFITLGPFSSTFIFYFFNKMFRHEFNTHILGRQQRILVIRV